MTRATDTDESIPGLVTRLVTEGRELASAEIALGKARLSERLTSYKSAAIFFVAATVIALCALVAMLVGLILTIATLVGPGWATLIVAGIAFALALVLGLVGKSRLTQPAGKIG